MDEECTEWIDEHGHVHGRAGRTMVSKKEATPPELPPCRETGTCGSPKIREKVAFGGRRVIAVSSCSSCSWALSRLKLSSADSTGARPAATARLSTPRTPLRRSCRRSAQLSVSRKSSRSCASCARRAVGSTEGSGASNSASIGEAGSSSRGRCAPAAACDGFCLSRRRVLTLGAFTVDVEVEVERPRLASMASRSAGRGEGGGAEAKGATAEGGACVGWTAS